MQSQPRLGNKKNNLTVVYTPADNLKKTGDVSGNPHQLGILALMVPHRWQ